MKIISFCFAFVFETPQLHMLSFQPRTPLKAINTKLHLSIVCVCMCVRACVRAYVWVCVYVCPIEKERERSKKVEEWDTVNYISQKVCNFTKAMLLLLLKQRFKACNMCPLCRIMVENMEKMLLLLNILFRLIFCPTGFKLPSCFVGILFAFSLHFHFSQKLFCWRVGTHTHTHTHIVHKRVIYWPVPWEEVSFFQSVEFQFWNSRFCCIHVNILTLSLSHTHIHTHT